MIDPEGIVQKVRSVLESAEPCGSPCISVCRMDERTGWCEGCLRRLEEIGQWTRMSDAERRAVWARVGERALQLGGVA